MKSLYFLLTLTALAFLYLTIDDTRGLVGTVIAKMPKCEQKPPDVYIIAEVKDSKKVCKKEIRWCYLAGETLKCNTDIKTLPDNVTYLKLCTQ